MIGAEGNDVRERVEQQGHVEIDQADNACGRDSRMVGIIVCTQQAALLPGIGGALDLIDSILFTAPLMFFYMRFVIGVG